MKIVKFEVTIAVPEIGAKVNADDIRDMLYDKDADGCAYEVKEITEK